MGYLDHHHRHQLRDLTTAAIETKLRDALVQLRRAWPRPDQTHTGARRPGRPGSAAPGGAPTITRASTAATLTYWLRSAVDDGIVTIDTDQSIDTSDPLATSAALLANTARLSGWVQAPWAAAEITNAARAIDQLTTEPPDGIKIGRCPREVVRADGAREECGGTLRAKEDRASDVKCPRCGHTDTVEQWQRVICGAPKPVTTQGLCEFLAREGIRRVTPHGVRVLVHRGAIPRPTIEKGKAWFDPIAVMRALAQRDYDAAKR